MKTTNDGRTNSRRTNIRTTKRIASLLLITILVTINLVACQKAEQVKADHVELTILAAASLTDVTGALTDEFTKQHPEIELIYSYGSSGALQTQIEEGVKADLFFSAGKKQMTTLVEKGLIQSDTNKDLLLNKLVLIVPSDKMDNSMITFEDLETDQVNMIAMGDPAGVPVGQYTQQVFETLGIWSQVETKVNFGSDVRQVLTWVETGEADCGVVYSTDAISSEKVTVVSEAPEGSHDPIIYPVGILRSTQQNEAAKAYIEFLSGPEAKAVFESFGFTMYK